MDFVGKDLTEKITGCAYAVHQALGSRFLEKVFENAMVIELGKRKLEVQQQKSCKFRGILLILKNRVNPVKKNS